MRREFTPAKTEVGEPTLVWERTDAKPVEYTIRPERPITIGRDATNAIAIESPFVSKAHAIVQSRGGQFIVEDLKSANGTRVNGAPIAVYNDLKPGDVIEIGDQRLLFIDRAAKSAAAAGGGSGKKKLVRLALVAGGTGLVLMLVLMMLIGGGQPAAPAAGAAGGATPPAPATAPQPPTASQPPTATSPAQVHVVDTALIAEVEDRAKRAGVAAVDALYDEGIVHHQSGRYREAVQLFAAALQRDPKHIVARNRLAEAQADLERMISTELAEGNRAAAQLRFADAIVAYEKVVVLTYPSDPRNKDAQQRLDQARQRSPR